MADLDRPAPQTMGQVFDALTSTGVIDASLARRMRGAVGFRNVDVHNDQVVDWTIVFAISYDELDDCRGFAAAMAKLL